MPDNPTTALVKTAHSPALARVSNQLALTDKLLTKPEEPFLIPYRKGNKWGFCDRNKNIVIDCVYDIVNFFSDGWALVYVNDRTFFVNKFGQKSTWIKDYYEYAKYFYFASLGPQRFFYGFRQGYCHIKFGESMGAIDNQGNEVIPPKYEWCSQLLREGIACVKLNGKWGIVDKRNEIIIPIKYESIGNFYGNLVPVLESRKWGAVNSTNDLVISFKYDRCDGFENDIARVKLNNKFGFINKYDKVVIPLIYDDCLFISEGLIGVKVENKWGFIDENNQMVISPKYNSVKSFSEGLSLVQDGEKWLYINQLDQEIIKLSSDYESASSFEDGLAYVVKRGWLKWTRGLIDKSGREIVPAKYDYLSYHGNKVKLIEVEENSRRFFRDINGIEYWGD